MLAGDVDELAVERRALHRDGHVLWLQVRSSVQRTAEGQIDFIITQLLDVTEQRAQETKLRDSEARYRGLVELSQDLIVRLDRESNFTFVNDAWCATFGLRREDVLGRSVMPRILPADRTTARQELEGLGFAPHRTRVKIRQPTVEGVRWLEWEGCGIFDDAGNVVEIQAIGRDVTQAQEFGEALRASEARYRGVVESQQAVVFRLDLARRITFVNDYGARVIGVPRDEMLGKDVLGWVHPEDRPQAIEAFARALVPPHHASIDCRLEIADGVRWFDWEGAPIFDEEGRAIEVQAVGFDVTERRAAAERLEASLAELRRSEEKLRLFAQRQVAVREEERKRLGFDLHDGVCQELIGIGILVESARRRYEQAVAEGSDELARVSRYLGAVVDHLRLLAGELRPLLLHDLGLEESLRSLALGLATGATSVTASFPKRVPRLDEATEVTVYRIAQEALTNALRHAGARAVHLELRMVAARLRLEICDDGCGFDPSSRRTTALGLLSMEERALAIGGRLRVTSFPDAGTTIVLECPLIERTESVSD